MKQLPGTSQLLRGRRVSQESVVEYLVGATKDSYATQQ